MVPEGDSREYFHSKRIYPHTYRKNTPDAGNEYSHNLSPSWQLAAEVLFPFSEHWR